MINRQCVGLKEICSIGNDGNPFSSEQLNLIIKSSSLLHGFVVGRVNADFFVFFSWFDPLN